MAKETGIEDYTRCFLSGMGLNKDELAPSEGTYREVKVQKLNQVADPGDHVAVWRDERGYWHHGIFCGEDAAGDEFVLDLTPDYGVALRPFWDFIRGEDAAIVIDYDDNAFTKDFTLKCAEFTFEYAKEHQIKYNAVERNCDKLALMLRTGRWESSPIRLHRPPKRAHCASYSISAKLGLLPPPPCPGSGKRSNKKNWFNTE